jgi:hypothetical protein
MNEAKVIDSLERLGFPEDCIVETILVTRNQDGSYNAAPMGITRNGATLIVRPFKSTQTFRNLSLGESASINLSDNPHLFLATAFKEDIEDQPKVDDTGLEGADATIHSKTGVMFNESELRASFSLTPWDLEIKSSYPTVFSRGRSEAIKAIIHATRIQVFNDEHRDSEVQKLKDKVKDNLDVIKRVSAEGSQEYIVADKLLSLITKWGVSM